MSDRKEQMLDMYFKQKLSICDIAGHFNLSRQRVHQIIGPLGGNAHRGEARRQRGWEKIKRAHGRIVAGETTVVWEAKNLGIRPDSLRSRFRIGGLKLPERPPSPLHGTYYRYTTGCRCEECRDATRRMRAERYKRGPKVHGTASAYFNYGCRCDACRKAGSDKNRRDFEKRKLRKKERMPNE